ncbi:MAG: aspartate-semialdehyde dehydrogenase [Bermanella sp.]|jgi:aspartate-semialdehyde dehydrogenase
MRLAICGVGGQVAEGFIEQLEQSALEFGSLQAFVVNVDEAKALRVRGATVVARDISDADFAEYDLLVVFESVPDLAALAAAANELGCHVIDASLNDAGLGRPVVPELMAEERVDYPVFWSLPAPAISALAPVLNGLLEGNDILSVSALVCEPASALGDAGTRQLAAETAKLLNGQAVDSADEERLAFNVVPHVFTYEATGGQNLGDLLGLTLPNIHLESLQVPLFYGQTIQLTVVLKMPAELPKISAAWLTESVHVVDNKEQFSPIAFAEDDRIHVGRLRVSAAAPHNLSVWIIADNVRKSAVVNTIKLIEILIKSSI